MSTKFGPTPKPTLQRVLEGIKHQNGCWLWGSGAAHGYSHIILDVDLKKKLNIRQTTVHRIMYVLSKGSIPEGYVIDHLCGVRNCVNPNHLEAVTQKTNVHRAPNAIATINKQKTHCPQGHEYTASNTTLSSNRRKCRTCHAKREAIARAEGRRRIVS